jgi:hypothetical protein
VPVIRFRMSNQSRSTVSAHSSLSELSQMTKRACEVVISSMCGQIIKEQNSAKEPA